MVPTCTYCIGQFRTTLIREGKEIDSKANQTAVCLSVFLRQISSSFFFSDDPNERMDISEKHPDVVKELKAKLEEYKKNYVPPLKPPIDPKSNPSNYGGFWSPGWC